MGKLSDSGNEQRARWLALLALLVTPLILLGPCLFGNRTYVPFDLAQYSPAKQALTQEEWNLVTTDQNTDVTEVPVIFKPELEFTQQELAAGRLPEWNPYGRSGVPVIAATVTGLLYPLHWLALLYEDPADGLALVAYVSFAIAGMLMLGFLRAIGLGWMAATFGGLAFMLGGTLTANAHFYMRLSALVWIPGMLWAVLRISQREGWARGPAAAGLALCVGMTWLAGFPPYAAPATLVGGFYAGLRFLRIFGERGPAPAMRLGAWLGAGFLLGIGLAYAQMGPMFAFFPESNRPLDPGPESLSPQGFDPAGMLGYLFPSLFGHPFTTRDLPYGTSPLAVYLFTRGYWGDTGPRGMAGEYHFPTNYNFIEYSVFPGTLVLLMVFVAVLYRGVAFRGVAMSCLAMLLVLSFGLAAMESVHMLPGVAGVPPKRYLGAACALVAILGAIGLQMCSKLGGLRLTVLAAGSAAVSIACLVLRARTSDPATLWATLRTDILADFRVYMPELPAADLDRLIGVHKGPAHEALLANLLYGAIAFGAAAVWLVLLPYARRYRAGLTAMTGLAVLGTAAQLFVFGYPINHGRELKHDVDDTPIHTFLREQRDAWAATGGFTVARGAKAAELPWILPPCNLLPERIRDLSYYQFVDRYAHWPFFHFTAGEGQLWGGVWMLCIPDVDLRRPYLDLIGVRFVLSDVPLENARRVGPEWKGPLGQCFVYERDTALPRAFVVPEVRVVEGRIDGEPKDAAPLLSALASKGLDPRVAVLCLPDDAAGIPAPPNPATGAADRAVRFARDDPNDVVLEVGAGPGGYLVVNDTFISGWSATLDGAPVDIHRGNLFMRVVPLPDRACEVRFTYETPGLRSGAWAGVVCLVVLVGLCAGAWVRRRRA